MAAVISSLVITCKDNKIDFEAWQADILPQLGKIGLTELDNLLPHLWEPGQD